MFKVNNKNKTTTWLIYFTPFASVSIVNFEQVNVTLDHASLPSKSWNYFIQVQSIEIWNLKLRDTQTWIINKR